MTISILDNHRLLADLLKLSFLEFDFIKSVNIYTCPENYLAHTAVIKSDILIVDVLMCQMSGIDVIKNCRKSKAKSELKIIVLCAIKNPNMIREAFKAGANGYLCKDTSIIELIKAVKFVKLEEQKSYVGESIKDLLLQSQFLENVEFKLSPRDKDLLFHICQGKTAKEISAELNLTSATINSYIKLLMRKMEVNRTPDLILKAIKYGLFHPTYFN